MPLEAQVKYRAVPTAPVGQDADNERPKHQVKGREVPASCLKSNQARAVRHQVKERSQGRHWLQLFQSPFLGGRLKGPNPISPFQWHFGTVFLIQPASSNYVCPTAIKGAKTIGSNHARA